MRNFFAAIRQMMTTIMTTMKLVSRECWDAGVWTTKLAYEIIRAPVVAAARVADIILNIVDRPAPSASDTKADQARNTIERRVRTDNQQTSRDQIITDLARLVQRTARFRELGHASAEGLAAELPPVLQAWIKRLSTDECAKLAATNTRLLVEYLKADNVEAELPGIRPISSEREQVIASRRQVAGSARTVADAETTPEEQAVLSRLAERIKARRARTPDAVEDDMQGFTADASL